MKSVDEILERVGEIPPLPGTATKLIMVLNDPSATMNDIVEVIRYDQAIVSQILRLCNSAYYGLSRQVQSLEDAIRFLGTMRVFQLTMAVHSNALLAGQQRGYGLDPGVLWRHSVGVALGSSLFARRIELGTANLAFTIGLLHDIGKLVLNECVADEFAEIVRRVNEDGLSFTEAEVQVLGVSHEEIGGRIAERWSLPDPIVRGIRYHHDPQELEPPDPLVDVVYLADSTCLLFGVGTGLDGLSYRARPEVLARHHLGEQDIETIGAAMFDELNRVEQVSVAGPVGRHGVPVEPHAELQR